MKILSIGTFSSNGGNNTCSHRNHCLQQLSTSVDMLDSYTHCSMWYRIAYKLSYYGIKINLPDLSDINTRIVEQIQKKKYDIVWIDKGTAIYPKTLITIKKIQPSCLIVHYMIDDIMNPHHKSKQIMSTITLYDYYIVNRKANITELLALKCKNPIFAFMSYESSFHYPRLTSASEQLELGGDIGFIGTYERERANSICYLVDHGLKIRIWGNGWDKFKKYSPNLIIEGKGIFDDKFCKAIAAFKINLAFLRKKSRDLHTTRSTEIPACGGFMLAERTSEHQQLFNEGKEAEFFSTNEELLEKCQYYLKHEKERKQIAQAGTLRCKTAQYSNLDTIKKLLTIILPKT